MSRDKKSDLEIKRLLIERRLNRLEQLIVEDMNIEDMNNDRKDKNKSFENHNLLNRWRNRNK